MAEETVQFHIGEIDAEDDDLLDDAFVTTSHYSTVLKDKYYLVLGRKGSGKTALLNTIAVSEADNYIGIVQIKPEDINAEHLELLRNSVSGIPGFPMSLFVANTWKTFIWATVIKHLAQENKNKLITNPELKMIYDYAVQKNLIIPDPVSKFVRYAGKIAKQINKVIKEQPEVDLMDLVCEYPYDEPQFSAVKEAVINYLKGKKFLVLIDHVDEYDIMANSTDNLLDIFYTSLLGATKYLHTEKVLTVKLALTEYVNENETHDPRN